MKNLMKQDIVEEKKEVEMNEKETCLKWFKERNEKDKSQLIDKYRIMPNQDFDKWFQTQWPNQINIKDISNIRFVIRGLSFFSTKRRRDIKW